MEVVRGVPYRDGRSRRRSLYPWNEMEVGDSFFVVGKTQNNLATTSRYHTAITGKIYSAAKEGVGVRVWRIK